MSKMKQYSLVFLRSESKVLLGYKKRGFGCGRWNGFGGKLLSDETILDCAKREVKEECNLDCDQLDYFGLIHFEFVGNPVLLEVHAFQTFCFSGTLAESDEMKPEWFDLNSIPYDQMWTDDAEWWPYFLDGKKFKAYFKFEGETKILDRSISVVDTL